MRVVFDELRSLIPRDAAGSRPVSKGEVLEAAVPHLDTLGRRERELRARLDGLRRPPRPPPAE